MSNPVNSLFHINQSELSISDDSLTDDNDIRGEVMIRSQLWEKELKGSFGMSASTSSLLHSNSLNRYALTSPTLLRNMLTSSSTTHERRDSRSIFNPGFKRDFKGTGDMKKNGIGHLTVDIDSSDSSLELNY
jgi:hypothetical protein